ncbi:MAG TPA: Coenzyme F420 hydrogenase/dehydrogenase, beta subunit C-terminal domain [Candidatus Glassbacteria bacterium]|nr:Coenzyme F420 hydrogenase/dehydrogenase, beta subunit C-terminal domain [Candidatus Glassbacteria bacterium]
MKISQNRNEITLKINGIEVSAIEGTSILDVAKKIGLKIPTLCHHPAIVPFGACRVCIVEIIDKRGRKKIVTSCNYPVFSGLVVETASEKTIRIRKLLLELLLARCPNAQAIKKLASEYGIEQSTFRITDSEEDCILCGLCARVCEEKVGVSAINFANRGVKREVTAPFHSISDDCVGCGACAIVCPTDSKKVRINTYPMLEEDYKEVEEKFLTGKPDELLGVYTETFSAKSSIDGQDGGVVTALLLSSFEMGLFDAVIVVKRTIGYKAEAIIAETPEEILNARGTKYSRVKMMSKIGELIERGKRKIAIVGTPCEVRTARKIQLQLENKYPELKIIIIGLFCFEAFDYEKLKEETKKILNIDLDKAEKTQIQKGKFIVQIKGIEYSSKIKDFNKAIQAGCAYCGDFAANLADVSIGSVGSNVGYSTIIVRSTIGATLVKNLNLTTGEVRKEEIIKLAGFKKKRAEKNFGPIIEGI